MTTTRSIRNASLLLAFVMLLMAAPWQLLCVTHPTGHEHHAHEGPTPCELHAKYGHTNSVLPPMHCKKVQLLTDDFELQRTNAPAPEVSALFTPAFQIDINFPEIVHFSIPDPRGNSDPPLPYLSLRAPPSSAEVPA